MFLTLLQRRNPGLLRAAAELHRSGALSPNTWVLDTDAIERNARAIATEAARLGLDAFAMTKQIGRNPDAAAAIRAGGIGHAVGVDLECAQAAALAGLAIGHLGHLVQIPRSRAAEAAALEPLFWTVFSEAQARWAGEAARATGREQAVLVRVVAPEDRFYTGHEGGFPVDEVVQVARLMDEIPGVRFGGITTFPATLFDAGDGDVIATPNRRTLTRARAALEAAGFSGFAVNAPGTTSTATLAALAEAGATQVEPGHGLTGTTPLHAARDLVEDPAIAYVSEVSHLWNGRAYVYGGGLYADPVLGIPQTRALLVRAGEDPAEARQLRVEMPAPEAIDYYATVPLDIAAADGSSAPLDVREGDTVIFGFRPQVFVTRSETVGIGGLATGTPVLGEPCAANGGSPVRLWGGAR
ncbi:MAG: alanine racemase [Actinobacteria bacterium]|nr:alanine racemase [Actinomycetota bacterium]